MTDLSAFSNVLSYTVNKNPAKLNTHYVVVRYRAGYPVKFFGVIQFII